MITPANHQEMVSRCLRGFTTKENGITAWISVVNVFRASIVLGTPGSGKSYAIVNNPSNSISKKGLRSMLSIIMAINHFIV